MTGNVALLPFKVDCSDIGVATVKADVYDVSGKLARSGGPWECEDQNGIIEKIKKGTNYTVECLGMDGSGDVICRGVKTGITVKAKQTTDTGEIVLEYARPTVSITSPQDGSSHYRGDTITFEGTWSDLQDDTLPDDSLVWTSSMDGQIGTGANFTRDDLSAGSHTITLTVTDSHGAKHSDECSIVVFPFEWVELLGTTTNDSGSGIAVDTNGNAYITGYTSGNLDGYANAGEYDIFIWMLPSF